MNSLLTFGLWSELWILLCKPYAGDPPTHKKRKCIIYLSVSTLLKQDINTLCGFTISGFRWNFACPFFCQLLIYMVLVVVLFDHSWLKYAYYFVLIESMFKFINPITISTSIDLLITAFLLTEMNDFLNIFTLPVNGFFYCFIKKFSILIKVTF